MASTVTFESINSRLIDVWDPLGSCLGFFSFFERFGLVLGESELDDEDDMDEEEKDDVATVSW